MMCLFAISRWVIRIEAMKSVTYFRPRSVTTSWTALHNTWTNWAINPWELQCSSQQTNMPIDPFFKLGAIAGANHLLWDWIPTSHASDLYRYDTTLLGDNIRYQSQIFIIYVCNCSCLVCIKQLSFQTPISSNENYTLSHPAHSWESGRQLDLLTN